MITKFDRAAVRELQAAVESAVKPVAAKYGVGVVLGGARFSSSSAVFKLEVAVKSSGGVLETQEARDYRMLAPYVGLPFDTLGKTFAYGGEEFKIVGWRYRSRRAPVVAQRCRNGKRFVFSEHTVKAMLGLGASTPQGPVAAVEEGLAG
jgi:hypothetical protein